MSFYSMIIADFCNANVMELEFMCKNIIQKGVFYRQIPVFLSISLLLISLFQINN